MTRRPIIAALATFLVVAVVAPSTFFIMPQKAEASGGCIAGLLGGLFGGGGMGEEVPTDSKTVDQTTNQIYGTTLDTCLNQLIWVPLTRAAIKGVLQDMTASIAKWVSGDNGTGRPAFVVNMALNLQRLGDSTAGPFIAQTASAFNSPFGPAIASSLQRSYAQQSSMAGFYAANRCTLNLTTSNLNGFLTGDWSQGGAGTWLALTKPTQNNPYILKQNSQSQLDNSLTQAEQNRRQEVTQSGGFSSYCGPSSGIDTNGDGAIDITDTCTNADGSSGSTQTPGIVIHDIVQKGYVDLGYDQELALLGSLENSLDSALSQVMTEVFDQALNGDRGGLSGANEPSGNRPSLVTQLNGYVPDTNGVSSSATSTAQAIIDRLNGFFTAIGTIHTAADTASTTVASLATYCFDNASSTQKRLDEFVAQHPGDNSTTTRAAIEYLQHFIATANSTEQQAQAALKNTIGPVLTNMEKASSTASTTRAAAYQVIAEAEMKPPPISLANDVANLTTMNPSVIDVSDAQKAAQETGNARTSGSSCTPETMLVVQGGTLLDQMKLLDTNAQTLRAACNPVASTTALTCNASTRANNTHYSGGSGGGGSSDDSSFWSIVLTIILLLI